MKEEGEADTGTKRAGPARITRGNDGRFLFSEKTEQEMRPAAQLETLHTLKEESSPSSQTGRTGVRTGPERDKFTAMEAVS